jgi:hypothetical protein
MGSSFADLLAFGRLIADRCGGIAGEPLVYGSLAYVAHTQDWSLGLNDIDFLVPEASFPGLLALLRADPELTCEETTYHSIKVRKRELKVSFDGVEAYLAGIAAQPIVAEIDGFSFRVIDPAALIEVYRRGAASIAQKREVYLGKARVLALAFPQSGA